jgi:hypothetical protein
MAQTTIGIIFIIFGVHMGFCGQFHVRHGRNFRGLLSSGFLPRRRPRVSDRWGPAEWRRNGRRLLTGGAVVVALGIVVEVAPR